MDRSARLRREICILLFLPFACRERPPTEGDASVKASVSASATAPASAEPSRVRRPAPQGAFDCAELRPVAKTEERLVPETIELVPPGTGKRVFFSHTGERLVFDREDFLKAARCMKLDQAVRFLEEETGKEAEAPILDAFQLSDVVAAMLDAGRAGVRLEEETTWRKAIVRDGWSAGGCAGRCRTFGRVYRLSEDDSRFFFRVTDHSRSESPR